MTPALTAPTVRVKEHVQTRAEMAAVYRDIETRDGSCRMPIIQGTADNNGAAAFLYALGCDGRTERHHAGNTIGSKRITDARHVVLLCQFHHRTWAPTHSRLILERLAAVEDAREVDRDIEEMRAAGVLKNGRDMFGVHA
jgi:hypothetical protein